MDKNSFNVAVDQLLEDFKVNVEFELETSKDVNDATKHLIENVCR